MPNQNTSPSEYPQAVLRQIALLAQNITIARKRRGETQAQWALKLGVSQPTMARIERGDPSVAMVSYVMCLWLVNQAEGLADLIAPSKDQAALEREVARVDPKRKAAARRQAGSGIRDAEPAQQSGWPALAAHAVREPSTPQVAAAPEVVPGAAKGKRSAVARGLAALMSQTPDKNP